ncbi:MAG: PTS system mannose/fructose/N-acetylgalactosamine-transporter subunit IIB [Gemmatimonadales bacterium]
MPVVLYRIDDRFIHGQVVIGWGRPLGVDTIILVDDQVRTSEWEQELYRMAVPAEITVRFLSVEEAAADPEALGARRGRSIVLTGDVATMAALHDAGVSIPKLNLGGVHHRPGRTERLPYLFLTEAEYRTLQRLASGGTEIEAQDLPTSPHVNLRALG